MILVANLDPGGSFLLPTHATLGAVELAAPAAFSRP